LLVCQSLQVTRDVQEQHIGLGLWLCCMLLQPKKLGTIALPVYSKCYSTAWAAVTVAMSSQLILPADATAVACIGQQRSRCLVSGVPTTVTQANMVQVGFKTLALQVLNCSCYACCMRRSALIPLPYHCICTNCAN
jgi:hypothetical protein